MAGMFVATVIGNLGTDPEVKFSEKGTSVTKFSMAVNGPKKDSKPTWVRVTVFGKQGEIAAEYLRKGRQAAVNGRVSVEEFTRKDGTAGFSVELIADTVTFIGSKDDAAGASTSPTPSSHGPSDSDVPF